MIELERIDLETGKGLVAPFYLLQDSSMINFNVFRSPSDIQYASLNLETFEQVRRHLISRETIDNERFTAQMDQFPNAILWHAQRVDSLWRVSEVRDFENWYQNSSFAGYISGPTVVDLLPNTYQRFQGKRDELRRNEEAHSSWLNSRRLNDLMEAPF